MTKSSEKRKYCGAKTRNGGVCKKPPLLGKTRCKLHGGLSVPAGPEHHSYKSGRTSKFLPGKLNEVFLEAYSDPELLSLRKYAAIYDVRVRLLARRLYTGESGGLWLRLGEQWTVLESAQNAIREEAKNVAEYRDAAAAQTDEKERNYLLSQMREADARRNDATKRFGTALGKIGSLIASGKKDETSWRELLTTADEASAMKFRETKRLEAERMMVPIAEVMTLVSVIYGHCRESCDAMLPADVSKRLLIRIGDGLNTLLNSQNHANRKLQESMTTAQDAVVINVDSGSLDEIEDPLAETERET
jgi:hypothetical protein